MDFWSPPLSLEQLDTELEHLKNITILVHSFRLSLVLVVYVAMCCVCGGHRRNIVPIVTNGKSK